MGIRFVVYLILGQGSGHIQSLILASMMIIIGVLAGVIGLLADVISANRKLLEEIQFELRRMDYGQSESEKMESECTTNEDMNNELESA